MAITMFRHIACFYFVIGVGQGALSNFLNEGETFALAMSSLVVTLGFNNMIRIYELEKYERELDSKKEIL